MLLIFVIFFNKLFYLYLIIVIIINNLHKCEYSAKTINQILYTVVKHLKWVGIHRYSAKNY